MAWVLVNSNGTNTTPQPSVSGIDFDRGVIYWEPIVSAVSYKVYISATNENYVGEVSGTSIEILDLDPTTNYKVRVVAKVMSSPGVFSFTTQTMSIPSPLRYEVITTSQEMSTLNNDGGLWFWPSGGLGSFHADIKNNGVHPYTSAEIHYESIADPASPIRSFSIGVNNNYAYTSAISAIESGGTSNSPKIGITPNIQLAQPLNPGELMHLVVVRDSGVVTNAKTFGQSLWQDSLTVQGEYFVQGDSSSSNPGGGVLGIGPCESRIYLSLPSSATPRVIWDAFGDSTIAQVRSIGSTAPISREGIWYNMNLTSQTSGRNVRVYSRGQGGASWDTTLSRVRANLPSMVGKSCGCLVQVWTWNSPHTATEQAEIAWNQWLDLKTDIESYGLVGVPMIIHPPTTRTLAGQVSAWQYLKNQVSAVGGLLLDDILSSNGIDIDVQYSDDNVHANQLGGQVHGSVGAPRLWTLTENIGWVI